MESGVKLFECVKVFEVEEDSTIIGSSNGESSDSAHLPSSIGIDLCCWSECVDHSMLVLFCNNGYLVMVMTPTQGSTIVKQLKWFEARELHILGLAMDCVGEWLACACLEGTLYLLPALSLCNPDHQLRNKFGPNNDISTIKLLSKKAQPTNVVWWESMDGNHICITASEIGEVTFFDVKTGTEVAMVMVEDCIDHMLLAAYPSHSTYLLVGLRGGQWRRQMLEEQYHEAAGTSYTDAQASGFEIVPDDIVVKGFLQNKETVDPFDFKPFPYFSEFNVIMTQDWRTQHFLSALNLKNYRMEVYTYDFELLTSPLRTFQLVDCATGGILLDRMLFVISHNDEQDPCSFTLNLMSSQRASISDLSAPTPAESNSVLQKFRIPSHSNLVGFFSTSVPSSELTALSQDRSCDQPATPTTNLGGCVVVTTTGVYQCRQVLSPEATFLRFVMSSKSHEQGEEFGITYRLDVCGLYKEAAEKKLQEGEYKRALKLFELSRCSPSKIIDSYSRVGHVSELVQYLHQLVYDDTSHTSLSKPKHVQNVLLRCFVHECLRLHGRPEGAVMVDKFTQFLSEKFLYDQTMAMDLLIETGLKEQLFDLAKTHHKLADALDRMIQLGALDVGHTLQPSLASRQYVKSLTGTGNGLFLHQMTPANFVRVLYAKPSVIPAHLGHLRSVMPQLDVANLLRIARLFDPSHSTIRPLLIKAHTNRRQSNSTGSLVSVALGGNMDNSQEEHTPRLEAYLETFLIGLIILNQLRTLKPSGLGNLLSLSPLRSAVSGTSPGKSPASYTEGSQWVRGSTLSCGMNHAAVVTHSDLYTWGATKNGKLGHGDIEDEGKALPLRVETIHMLSIHVVSVSCGAEHTIALCQEGVFSWGSSLHGQLGHGDMLKKTRPVQITALADKSIVAVVCGQYHSLALDDDHQVWSWGWGVHGQLGLKSVDDRTMPTHSSLLDNKQVSFISAGYGHSAILTAEGKVYTFGNGMYGQLGHGNTEKQSSPRMVEQLTDKTVYLLACGNFHTVVVTTEQEIFFWGKNFSRQQRPGAVAGPQGLKDYKKTREKQTAGVGGLSGAVMPNTLQPVQLTEVELDDTVLQISCGNYHSLLLTSAGSVYAWGSNVNGQLGLQSGEVTTPKRVEEFEGHKIVAIATGDEFSLAVDEKGLPWVWGKGDKGQLGISMEDHSSGSRHHAHRQHTHEPTHARRHHTLFKPHPLNSVSPGALGEVRSPKELSPDPNELPILELDLGWNLPDFATIDSPHTPYGRKALDAALEHLHGFYRTAHVLWQCEDRKDWQSMTTIASLEQHWPQALRCAMTGLVEEEGVLGDVTDKAVAMVKEYLDKLLDEHSDLFSGAFLLKAVDLLDSVLNSWEEHGLNGPRLEVVLTSYLSSFSYPLSLILMRPNIHVSPSFQLAVAQEVLTLVCNGHPTPTSIIESHTSQTAPEGEVRKVTIETTKGDIRMWAEILRNLMKDLSRNHSIALSENVLMGIRGWQPDESIWEKGEPERRSSLADEGHSTNENAIAAFSCGHAHPMGRFLNHIVPEFVERVQNFPLPHPQTLRSLQTYYKQAQSYPSACPHCVFQFLRKLQIEECPKVPIRPWSL